MNFKGRKILITGGLGFIGSNLAIRLVNQGAYVTVIDSLIPNYGGNLENIKPIREMIRVNISDVRDQHSMKFLVQGQDYLFNLAGQTSHMDSMQDPETDLEINARAQLSILEACRQHNPGIRIVFASTRQIYGKPQYLPVDEKHPIIPVDVNGINKTAGEQYHLLYNHVYGIRSTVLRLTNTYGPRMRIKDARQTFVGVWVKQVLLKESFEVWGGRQLRDFNYVDDCVSALLLAAGDEAVGQVFNLGGSEVVTLRQLAMILAGVEPEATFIEKDFPADRKKIDIGDYYSDFTKITSLLGWKPEITLETGLAMTMGYYRGRLNEYL